MRWGILGTGGIAGSFASDLRLSDAAVAVIFAMRMWRIAGKEARVKNEVLGVVESQPWLAITIDIHVPWYNHV